MAYTATFAKESVSKKSDVINTISINVSISDGVSVVLEKTYSKDYNSNTTNLDNFKSAILSQLQSDWQKYLSEKAIFESQTFDTAISQMQTTANNYLNQ